MPRILRQAFQPSAVAAARAAIGPFWKSRLRGAMGMTSEEFLGRTSGGILIPAGTFVLVEVTHG